MPDFRAVIRERLRAAGISPLRETEIVEELALHLSDRYDALRSSGATDAEALRAIHADLDQRDLAAELRRVESAWSEPVTLGRPARGQFWFGLWRDVRYAARLLRLSPGFTAACITSLALGIGANTAIFQLLDAVRMRTLPVPNPQELVIIRPAKIWRSGHMTGRFSISTNPQFQQVRALQRGFSGVLAWGNQQMNLNSGGQARMADGLWVSGSFFDVLQVQPILGRVFHEADDRPGCGAPGAVISYSFWQGQYGGDPTIVGKTTTLEGHAFPILGVTPAGFTGIDVGHTFDVAMPLCSEPVIMGEQSIYNERHGWWLAMMGRLKPGWTMERAAAQLQAVSPEIMKETVPTIWDTQHVTKYLALTLTAMPAANGFSSIRSGYQTPLWLLLAIAGLVLLIGCANLANLMLARSAAREREIAMRLALGAARGRLIRQLLTESVLLAVAGALLGIALAGVLSQLLVRYLRSEDGSRIFVDLTTDWRVLGFTIVVTALTCALFGVAPAVKATRADPGRILSLVGRGLTASRERFSLRRILVVSQVALSLVLVVSALLFSFSLRKILTLDAGLEREGVLIMDIDFTRLSMAEAQRNAFAAGLLERVRAIPGIDSAAENLNPPLTDNWWNDRIVVDDKPRDISVNMAHVSPGYFKTMGTPILAGRDFDQHDAPGSPYVAIVSQEFARKFFNGADPIGRTFKIDVNRGARQPLIQIVGMVGDSKYYDLREEFTPMAYYAKAQDMHPDASTRIIVSSGIALDSLLASLRATVAGVNPDVAIDFHVFDEQIKNGLLRERLLATLSGFFGGLAIVLATVGLYGVIAHSVVQRTKEIGVRIALGAQPRGILTMIVAEGFKLLAAGLAVGLILTLWAGKVAATLLYGLKPNDPLMLVIAATALTGTTIAASLMPAIRAAHLDPMVALRQE
jgi:predicted permease